MIKTSHKICNSCKYGKQIACNVGYCDYLTMTGNLRNCEIGECDKYEKFIGRKKPARSLNYARII